MIRFRVLKGSHLALGLAVVILLAVILFMLLGGNSAGIDNNNPYQPGTEITQSISHDEAKAVSAFASTHATRFPLKIQIIAEDSAPEENSNNGHILIYHTHTHEAYEQDLSDPYVAVETWRTLDETHSVVRVGSLLADELRTLGYSVVHDTTDHEQDSLNNSYVRSLNTLNHYENEFDLCIDLHRDAYIEGIKQYITDDQGTEYAQIMCLIGRGDLYEGNEKPDYAGNLEYAQQLTYALNERIPGICRNVTVKTGRYNQHIGKTSVLLEVGHNMNTLHQALNSIPHLAMAIDSLGL